MSSPVGEVVPGLLPRCMIRAGLGGAVAEVVDLLFATFFLLGSLPLAAEESSLATCLTMVAPKFSEPDPCPTIIENDYEKRGRGRVFLGGT